METIGPELFGRDFKDPACPRIASLYPEWNLVITEGVSHYDQRVRFAGWLLDRTPPGATPPTKAELAEAAEKGISLIIHGGQVQIRSDGPIARAFEGDEWMQSTSAQCPGVPKDRIRFVVRGHRAMQAELRRRGELWRMALRAQNSEQMDKYVRRSRISMGEVSHVYYSPETGTRFLTLEAMTLLAKADDQTLEAQVTQIWQWRGRYNRFGEPEVELFGASIMQVWPADLGSPTLQGPVPVRHAFGRFLDEFGRAMATDLAREDFKDGVWVGKMYCALAGVGNEAHTAEHVLQFLSPEYFLQVEWLPGGRFFDREFQFDEMYPRPGAAPLTPSIGELCLPLPRAIISNYIREYTNIEYLNLGRVNPTLNDHSGTGPGRREVFLMEVKIEGEAQSQVHVLRFQKWGVRERLKQRKSLEQAFRETDEYTEYILDRRLGCRQLGMRLPEFFTMHRIEEIHPGAIEEGKDFRCQATYFARAYIRGLASDKFTDTELMQPGCAVALAQLLGKAAATNLIVGRATDTTPSLVIFDRGDEIIVKDPVSGLPVGCMVGDHSSTFNDYTTPMREHIREYATPVRKRLARIPEADRGTFREAYVTAFETEFTRILADYANRRDAFDHLFAWARYDRNGSFAFRWENVLRRLRETDLSALVAELRHAIDR